MFEIFSFFLGRDSVKALIQLCFTLLLQVKVVPFCARPSPKVIHIHAESGFHVATMSKNRWFGATFSSVQALYQA